MMRATCQDLMGSGVHTAMVCPGFTDTEMLRTHLGHDEDACGYRRNEQFRPPDRAGRDRGAAAWAHENPVINGAVLHANLGQMES